MALEQTARAVRRYQGIDAITSSSLEPDLHDVDIVHLFGIVRPQEAWIQARNARRQGKPIVLSTVYCDVTEFERQERMGPVGWLGRHASQDAFEALKAVGRGLHNREWGKGSTALITRGFTRMEREIAAMTSVFAPSSWSEWQRLSTDLDLAHDRPVVVVPLGVDLEALRVTPAAATRPTDQFAGAVLCVARIEGRKNQLRLIEALAPTDLQLVLAGQPAPNQTRYVSRVKRAAQRSRNVHYLGPVSEASKRSLYAAAKVHVLASWMETLGFSSLEAAVAGCSLVISPNGDTREYFRDYAEYCDPADPASIRAAVLRAYQSPPSEQLLATIGESYTWQKAAEATHVAYQAAVRTAPP